MRLHVIARNSPKLNAAAIGSMYIRLMSRTEFLYKKIDSNKVEIGKFPNFLKVVLRPFSLVNEVNR